MMLLEDDSERAWQRAAEISLMTWRRADPGDVLDDDERYGWWGDSFPGMTDDRIGSRLYLLRRRKLDADTVRDAEAFARESLAWILDDGRVSAVAVTVTRGTDRLDLAVAITLRDGRQVDFTSEKLWQVINAV